MATPPREDFPREVAVRSTRYALRLSATCATQDVPDMPRFVPLSAVRDQ